ncbi:MAG: chondroitinase family polysaccharide lyase [Ginsengibacter sp.]
MFKTFAFRKIIFLLFLFLVSVLSSKIVSAQIPDICEELVPSGWQAKGGSISMGHEHFKAGKESVLWKWDKHNASLEITDTAFESAASNPRNSFVIWIYNEKPLEDKLLFEFEKDGEKASSFTFNLNFKGWRTAWVMYHRDMDGKPIEGMNQLIIHAPASVKKGSLYFDQVLYNVSINPRSPMRDEQVPFVNIHANEAANAHWTALYWFTRNPHYLALPDEVTPQDKKELEAILKRYKNLMRSDAKYKKIKLSDLEQDFSFWDIKRKNNEITGRPVYSMNDVELFSEGADKSLKNNFKQYTVATYTELMLNVAGVYSISKDSSEKKHLAGMFMNLLDNLDDQGWSAGSGMGALHHLGYNFRDFYVSCLMMKPVLKQNHVLDRTINSMYWFSGLGRTQVDTSKVADSNIDVFNTLLGSMLSTILIMDDSPGKVRQMQEYAHWLSQSIMPTYSIDGTFKPDGSVVHHGNLYPAYGVGGLQGITPIVYSLGKTSFRVNPVSQQELKKVMLMMHYYTNPLYWPVSVSGRHPTGNLKIASDAYAYMALAGSPNGEKNIDEEMAAIYRGIVTNDKDKWAREFKALGIQPAPFPHGHWNINYGLLDIHRRSDWLLTVRGHNRYFTTHESYPGANMYGRYLSYGFLEVTYPQTPGDHGSSFKDKGWDWNNIPGTTTLHVPLDKLRARILNVDDFSGVEEMLLSDQIFAGGTNLNQWQGMFAMKLHGHDKYDMGSFRAIKSWFMFDSIVVCLGSNITNNIKDYSTQTTLFQNNLDRKQATFFVNNKKDTSFPYQQKWDQSNDLSIIDNCGIGYYLPKQKSLVFTKKEQTSRDQTDTKDTHGNVAKLIFDHGSAPQNQSYEYAMLIETNPVAMGQLKASMESPEPVYKVLRKDSIAHTVYYAPKHITASAFFKSDSSSNDSLVISNNRPCLMMYQKNNNTLNMSVTDPDLAFYTGPDDSPLTADGKRKEVSIYSRSWYKTPSQPSVVELIIKGRWKNVVAGSKIKITVLSNGNTQLSIPCEYGLASKIELMKD